MPTPSISADNPATADASPAERIALVLCGLLPAGAELAVCWRDWALGNGSGATPGASGVLRRRAEHALSDLLVEHDSPELRVYAWDNADGNARIAMALALPQPLPEAEEASWEALARTLLVTSLDAWRASTTQEASSASASGAGSASASATRALPSALSQAYARDAGPSCSIPASARACSARRRTAADAPAVAPLPLPSAQSRQQTASSAPSGSSPHSTRAIRSAGEASALAGLSALIDGVGMVVVRPSR